jgi:hypothetical protein
LEPADSDQAKAIGKFFEHFYAPSVKKLPIGPLKDAYDLCDARTDQHAVGTLLYYMVYGHEPYDE